MFVRVGNKHTKKQSSDGKSIKCKLVILLMVAICFFIGANNGLGILVYPIPRQLELRSVEKEFIPAASKTSVHPTVDGLFDCPNILASPEQRTDARHELVVIFIGDSITFGNGSHNTHRKSERRGSGEGSFPAQFQHLLLAGNRQREKFQSIKVFNFGVSGSTVSSHRSNKRSYSRMPEYRLAQELLKEVIAVSDEGFLMHSIDNLDRTREGFQPVAGGHKDFESVSAREEMRFVRAESRTVLIFIKLGTNDSKDKAWISKNYFQSEYISLVKGLFPSNFLKHRHDSSERDLKRSIPRIVIVFLTPIPAFPRPSTKAFKRDIIGGIRGQRIATDIRNSVLSIATQIKESLKDSNVYFFDLYQNFLPILCGNDMVLRTLIPSLTSDNKPQAERDNSLDNNPNPMLSSEQSYLDFIKHRFEPRKVFEIIHDGVHPSRLGHSEMARQVWSFVSCE